jgi:hypothetical protein
MPLFTHYKAFKKFDAKLMGGVDFLSKSVVKNIIPVESVMCKRRVFVLALLKGMEVKLHPLMAEA